LLIDSRLMVGRYNWENDETPASRLFAPCGDADPVCRPGAKLRPGFAFGSIASMAEASGKSGSAAGVASAGFNPIRGNLSNTVATQRVAGDRAIADGATAESGTAR
jgi:hypothetical protein